MLPLKISWQSEPSLDEFYFLFSLLSGGIPCSLTRLSLIFMCKDFRTKCHIRYLKQQIYFLMNLGVEVQALGVILFGPLKLLIL